MSPDLTSLGCSKRKGVSETDLATAWVVFLEKNGVAMRSWSVPGHMVVSSLEPRTGW